MNNEKRLYTDLTENLDYMKKEFGVSADFTVRKFVLDCEVPCAVITMEGMINKETLAQSVLNPLIRFGTNGLKGDALFNRISISLISASETVVADTFDKVFGFIMSGFAVIAVDGSDKMLAVGIQGFSFRGISEPETEITQRGSREGFVEPLRINMTLIRRRIKNPKLTFESMKVGDLSKTDICLCYLSDTVSQNILDEIKHRLKSIKIPTVLASGYLIDFLENRGDISLFSGVGISERPDTVCGKITEGRVAIMIDGTPSVLIVPYLFTENFQTLDDYSDKPYFATLTRWLKYLAFFISIFSPGIYVAAVVYNPEIFPEDFLTKIAVSVSSTPFPILWEVLIIHFIYEIMREAGLRLPRSLGHAVSIVGALVIGETAVNAGLIGAPTLMIVALTAISSYVIPNLYAPIAILRLLFIVIGGFFGIWGISIFACLMLVDLCGKNSLGVPFTTPISPVNLRGFRDVFVRSSWKTLSKRRFIIQDAKGFEKDI